MNKMEFSIKDNILYGPYPEGVELDLEFVKNTVAQRLEFLEGKELPALIDTTGVKSATKEARDYFAKAESSAGLKAAALLSRSTFSTFLSNFFIKISLIKSPIPVRSFTKEEEAIAWLKQFK